MSLRGYYSQQFVEHARSNLPGMTITCLYNTPTGSTVVVTHVADNEPCGWPDVVDMGPVTTFVKKLLVSSSVGKIPDRTTPE